MAYTNSSTYIAFRILALFRFRNLRNAARWQICFHWQGTRVRWKNEGGPPEGGWRAAVRIRKPDKEDKGFAAPMHKGECFRPEGDGPVLGGSTSAGM